MSLLHPPETATETLTWRKETREYIGEVSDTHGFGRVYDDAIDAGLTLVGRFGGRHVFVITHEQRDDEGDVLWWILGPAERFPGDDFTVRLFND